MRGSPSGIGLTRHQSSANRSKDTNKKSGHREDEGPDRQHPECRLSKCRTGTDRAPNPTAQAQTDYPGHRTNGDEGQRDDLSVTVERPEATEHDGHGDGNRESRSVPRKVCALPCKTGFPSLGALGGIVTLHGAPQAYFGPRRASTTAMTATAPMPTDRTSGIGEPGRG
jgi:hypothetical protein